MKTTEELVAEAVATSGHPVQIDSAEFRRIIRRSPKGNLVTNMLTEDCSGYVAIKKSAEKRLRKICEAMIAEAPQTRAEDAAKIAAFAAR